MKFKKPDLSFQKTNTQSSRDAWESAAMGNNIKNQTKPSKNKKRKKLTQKEVAWFCEQLSTTQAAGMPLYRSLTMISNMEKKSSIGQAANSIAQQVVEGTTLSQAMKADEEEYSSLVVALVTAGEASGKIEDSLIRASKSIRSRLALRNKVRGAMFYPSAVMLVAMALITVMLTVVIPKFESIYASSHSALPAPTLFVIALSKKAPLLILFNLLLVGLLVGVLWKSRSDEKLARKIEIIKFRIPLVGSLLAKSATARIASTIGSLMGSGVSVIDALRFAMKTSGSLMHTDALKRVEKAIGEGSTLSEGLMAEDLFPELLVSLAKVGEESGDVPRLLERYAQAAETEIEDSAERITSLIEPLMMVLIGSIVGLFVLAMYLPIFNMGDTLGG